MFFFLNFQGWEKMEITETGTRWLFARELVKNEKWKLSNGYI